MLTVILYHQKKVCGEAKMKVCFKIRFKRKGSKNLEFSNIIDLDAIPRKGEEVQLIDFSSQVRSVRWFLNWPEKGDCTGLSVVLLDLETIDFWEDYNEEFFHKIRQKFWDAGWKKGE